MQNPLYTKRKTRMSMNTLFSLIAILVATASLSAEEASTSTQPQQVAQATPTATELGDIKKISEAFGHILGKNLETIGVQFDVTQVVKGLQDSFAGKHSPMTESECIQAITTAQELVFKQQCTTNLTQAETFLANNSKTTGVVSLEEGKVQYKVTESGKGDIVDAHSSPLIKYCGKYLDGAIFGSSKEEESISLDEIIPGLKTGLIGMREGEKRTIYIHPTLAYGTTGLLPPNSLLTFEIEVVKANSPIATETNDAENPHSAPAEITEIKTDIR